MPQRSISRRESKRMYDIQGRERIKMCIVDVCVFTVVLRGMYFQVYDHCVCKTEYAPNGWRVGVVAHFGLER